MSKRKEIIGVGTVMTFPDGVKLAGDLLECGHVVHFAEDRNGNLIHNRKFRYCIKCKEQSK